MKFIDEVTIEVIAGHGGRGCMGFRREKFIPFGGPDGGNGGNGGGVFLEANASLNTLVDLRFKRVFEARNGHPGEGALRTGKAGEDLIIRVPVGTLVFDAETQEAITDLTQDGERFCVAKGGFHGFGNAHYKSSTNRAPRQITIGFPGERRALRLELKLLADVGLLGLPNAGKSTLIRSISNATPKVADYPFTTLHPHLGVVRVGELQSFVVADIPGLIEGASEGAGLGLRFLKHLSRTAVLLHVVDINYSAEELVTQIHTIEAELALYDPELMNKTRWLVFNKTDLLLPEEIEERILAVTSKLKLVETPVFKVSAVAKQGTERLCQDLMRYLIESKKPSP